MRSDIGLCIISTLAGLGTVVIGGNTPSGDTLRPYDLGVIVVTAAKTVKPATVETISAKQIEERGAVTAAEALTTIPGVAVTAGRKNEAGVMIRGIASERVLLMIDGRPVNMPYYGALDLHTLQMDNVSRIQVTKGTPSLLYGVNGTGGAINIITSSPDLKDSYALSATASAGDLGNRRLQTNAQARLDKTDFSGTFSRNVSNGYRLSEQFSSPLGIEDGGIRDNSNFDRWNATGKAGYRFSDNNSAAVSCGYYVEEKGIPSPTDFAQFRRFKKWQRYFGDMTGGVMLPHDVNVRGKLYHDRYTNEMADYADRNLDSMTWDSFHDHRGTGGIVTADLPVRSHTVTRGINGKNESASTQGYQDNPRQVFSMATGSAALEGHFRLPRSIALTAGAGLSGSAAYGDGNTSAKQQSGANALAGVSAGFLTGGTFHCGVGLYKRYPTLSQLFSEERGNLDLRPETALNADLGLGYAFDTILALDATMFTQEFRELIVNYRSPGAPISRYTNVARAHSRGVESKASVTIPDAKTVVSFDYTYNATFDYQASRPLPYVPKNSAGCAVTSRWVKNLQIHIHAQRAGKRSGEAARVLYDGYTIL
ncbi:MAG: TonB-dependent receptor plug domain-containing protein, partial [Chitinispirillaceae bacterium]|nr:TonB-dependent receptor plug domain-containing protein [Chitinispirillaceae bacterium]